MNSLTPVSFAELKAAWIAYTAVEAAPYPTPDYWRAQALRIDVMGLLFDRAGGLIDNTEKYDRVEAALHKINEIRNSIVGYQRISWSAHIYPLVAALEEAGISGEGYDFASAKAKTQVQRIAELEAVIQRVIDDEESRPGGWGPDVTAVF